MNSTNVIEEGMEFINHDVLEVLIRGSRGEEVHSSRTDFRWTPA